MAEKSWAFCLGLLETLSTYGHQMGLASRGTFRRWAAKILPSYPGTVGWKAHRRFQAILVAFSVPSWLPKLLSIFPGSLGTFQAMFN